MEAADALAEFLSALHHQAPVNAPANPTRGIPLAGLKEQVDDLFETIADHVKADAACTRGLAEG